jgi:hypothetical protein
MNPQRRRIGVLSGTVSSHAKIVEGSSLPAQAALSPILDGFCLHGNPTCYRLEWDPFTICGAEQTQ